MKLTGMVTTLLRGNSTDIKYNEDVFISSRPKITLCEQIFVATKEMSHLVINSPHSYTKDIEKLVREIIYPNPIFLFIRSCVMLRSLNINCFL